MPEFVDLPQQSVTLSIGQPAMVGIAEPPNTVFAGPTSGSASFPTFRPLVAADLPGGASGTVTSVAIASSSPSLFNISGSPITTNGTITLQEVIQSSALVFAGPSSGPGSVAPSFRALVNTDLPLISLTTGVTGVLPVTNGGSSSGAHDLNAVLLGNDQAAFKTVLPGTSGNVLTSNGIIWQSSPATGGGGGGSGTVTSIAIASSSPSLFNVVGSPITTAGTITLQEVIQSSALVFAGPSSGPGSVAPSFRALVNTDLPLISLTTGVTGILPITNGGSSSGSHDLNAVLLGNTTSAFKTVLPGTSGNILTSNGVIWQSSPLASGNGTVTSVDMTVPGFLTVSGNPITTAGTLAITAVSQSPNTVYAGPATTGATAPPDFRPLFSLDIPAINLATSGNGGVTGTLRPAQIAPTILSSTANGGVTGILPVANGGSSSGSFALNSVLLGNDQAPFQVVVPGTSGNVLTSNGITWQSSTPVASGGTVTSVAFASSSPSIFNVSGSPVTTSGTITIQEVIQSSGTFFAGPSSGAGSVSPSFRALVGTDIPNNDRISAFGISLDGAGGAITPGLKGYLSLHYAAVITGWTLLGGPLTAGSTGSLILDVWKTPYASYPPTSANSIVAADFPTITNGINNRNLTATTWSGAVSAGDTLGFNVIASTGLTLANLTVRMIRN